MAKKLVYTVPATEVETDHVSVQVILIRNRKGELSATASLIDHSGATVTSIPLGVQTLAGFETFMKDAYDALRTKAGIREKS